MQLHELNKIRLFFINISFVKPHVLSKSPSLASTQSVQFYKKNCRTLQFLRQDHHIVNVEENVISLDE